MKTEHMEMKMNIDGKLLDSIKVYVSTSKDEAYLEWLKQGLRVKHNKLLANIKKEPVFYIETSSYTYGNRSMTR